MVWAYKDVASRKSFKRILLLLEGFEEEDLRQSQYAVGLTGPQRSSSSVPP